MKSHSALAASALFTAVALLSACASSPPRPDAQLARAEASLQQADQSGARQYSALEFDAARNKLGDAQRLADKGQTAQAGMLADQARVDADLAAAHARHMTADKAATEVRLATETLQQETTRKPTTSSSTP
jgi:hypothetical protein